MIIDLNSSKLGIMTIQLPIVFPVELEVMPFPLWGLKVLREVKTCLFYLINLLGYATTGFGEKMQPSFLTNAIFKHICYQFFY